MRSIVSQLLKSQDPAIRYKIWTRVLGRQTDSAVSTMMQYEIKRSARVCMLLSECNEAGKIPYHPYAKWYGAFWVLVSLAELGYPPDDEELFPLREQVYHWLLGESHQKSIETVNGRVRHCAAQEGNALYAFLMLGLADGRTDRLARNLIEWQWPDGGWNCDRRAEAVNSSFMETLIPLRALALYGQLTGNRKAKAAAEQAAEIFLKRRLYKKQNGGTIINQDFMRLHYPRYWHYDILFGLTVMADAGFIHDERCEDALNLLESKRLPDGGFPAEGKYYRVSNKRGSGRSLVNWGNVSKRHMNEFVTADALHVLATAGRPTMQKPADQLAG